MEHKEVLEAGGTDPPAEGPRKSHEPDVEDFTRQAVMRILHIMRNLRSTGMEMNFEVELSYPQMLALYVLLETGPATMTQLANWLKISHGVATRTIDRLCEKELVERRRDEGDRRVVFVSLSEEGSAYAQKMLSIHFEKLNEAFASVEPEERDRFLEMLDRIDRELEG